MVGPALVAAGFTAPQQEYLFQARQMQAMSFAVHIPLVAFAIALPSLVVFTEWMHVRTGNPVYRTLAKRWSKVMITLFAVGVVTGTVLSFELGLLWPNFMATFAGVFGLAFLCEGFSFFVEAIFIAIYVYGWDRMSPRLHLLSGIPVIIAGFAGALFVISVNGWMNHPGGFTLQNGQVTNVQPFTALFGNSFFWHELIHMHLAGFMVTGFVLAAVYAWGWLRGRRGQYERAALVIPLAVASLAAPVQIVVGDWAARTVGEQQPVKLAMIEGLPATTRNAPEHLLGWYDGKTVVDGIQIPDLLSILAFHDPNAQVIGLNSVPASSLPPNNAINTVRFAFQAMVGIGTLLALLGVVFVAVWIRRRRLPPSTWFYRALVLAGPLSVVALISGWITTEVGRQPWVVYGYMRTSEAVTGASGIPVGFGMLAAVYALLIVGVVWVLRRLARAPMDVGVAAGVGVADAAV
jgi:cytochrome d ubiquinol oxidase subunit I